MAGASAGIVFSGQSGGRADGTGSAAILDTHNDGWALIQSMQAAKAQEKLVAAEQKRQKAQDWGKLSRDMPDVWEVDAPYIQDELNRYSEELIKLKTSGADPFDIYSEKGREARAKDQSITKRANTAKENADFFNTAKQQIDKDVEGKYDKAHAAEWFKKYADPKLTPEQRLEMRVSSNPFKMDITDREYIADIAPDYTDEPYRSYVDEKATKDLIVVDFIQNPEYYEALKQEGETIDQTATRLSGMVPKIFPPKTKARPQGSTSNNSNNEDNPEFDLYGTPSYNPNFTGEAGKTNVITYTPKGQNFKQITFYDGAKPYTAGTFTIHPDVQNGQAGFVVEAEVLPDPPVEPPKLREGASDSEKETYRAEKSKYDAANDLYESGRKVKKKFWVSNVPGENGNDNYNTITSRTGTPPEQMLGIPVGGQPTAPAQGEMTQEQWNAAWSKLKSGETMVGLDGKTYKKK